MSQKQETDEIMAKLREVEHLASSSTQWTHYKGWCDVKTTFNSALAICEELRSHEKMARHAETKGLPSFVKGYVYERLDSIKKALEG